MTFGKPIRKTAGVTAKRRATKHRRLVREERENKAEARRRDGNRCRFPLCGCHERGLFVEVSHYAQHKGMGGDPTGQRSTPDRLICLCNWRHKEAPFSIDKKNLRAVPLTPAGANGPVAWQMYLPDSGWFELARESAAQVVIEPFTARGAAILNDLAEMQN